MGITLQQALALGAKPVPSSQSAATAAYQSFVQKNVTNAVPPQPTAPQPSLVDKVGAVVQGALQPLETVAGSGIRALQATPKVAAAVGDAITGNKTNEAANIEAAHQTMATPILGQNTMEGNTNEQNAGTAIQAASLLVPGLEGEGAAANVAKSTVTGALGAGGNALTDKNATAGSVLKATGAGAAIGAAAGAAPAVIRATTLAAEDANAGTSALHIPDKGIYAKITPEQQAFLKNETANIPFESTDRPHLSPLSSLESADKTTAQRVTLDELKAESPNAKAALDKFEQQKVVDNGTQVAQDAIKNPLTAKEQQAAVGQGRANINGVNKEIAYEPDAKTKAMTKSLQPLAESGDIVSPKTPEDHVSNISNTQKAIADQGQQIREGLSTSKAIWNENELKGRLDSVELPNVVKSEPALTRQAETFKEGIVKIANEADKHAVGILDLRQKADDLISQDFGKNFFDGDKNATAMRQYIYSVRDELNNFASDKLPDGKLPDGTSYRDALRNQSNLISAKDEMTQKFVREYPEGSTNTSRFMKDHPLISRALRSAPIRIGFGLLGVSAIAAAARKAVVSTASGK